MTTRHEVAATHLLEAKAEAWQALHAMHGGTGTADEYDDAWQTYRLACEQYRRRYHPDADTVFTVDHLIYARYPGGQVKKVWPSDLQDGRALQTRGEREAKR